jgi:hypothetical protein
MIDVVINEVRTNYPPRVDLLVSKEAIPHPEEYGLKPTVAAPRGQLANYRIPLNDDSGIHIKEYETHYLVHWDERDPSTDLIGHIVKDAPEWGVVIGAVAYYALTR